MRLGFPLFQKFDDPACWAKAHKEAGCTAVYCPDLDKASDAEIAAYRKAADGAGLVIAEVGAWSNPLSRDDKIRREAIALNISRLALAEKIGANCCVNIVGSRGPKWDGPCKDDLTEETFGLIVQTVREIIDAVKPKRTFYTLETMPWMFPDSPDSYLRLLKAIDRKAMAVHLDPANLLCSPQRYFNNGDLIRECFAKLGKHIKSCHAKDIILRDNMTVHLDETRPGTGGMDYRTYVREAHKCNLGLPLMIEHLGTKEDYLLAADYIKSVAREEGVTF